MGDRLVITGHIDGFAVRHGNAVLGVFPTLMEAEAGRKAIRAARDLSPPASAGLDDRAQHRFGGPSLTLSRYVDGSYFIYCDGWPVACTATFAEASAELNRLRAARAFAGEALHHLLTRKEA